MIEEERMFLLGMAARYARDGSGRRIRAAANVPMSEMARLVDVKIPTMSRWENGNRRPRGDAAVRWAAFLVRLEGTTSSNSSASVA